MEKKNMNIYLGSMIATVVNELGIPLYSRLFLACAKGINYFSHRNK